VKIAFFDSGIGGLTVLKDAIQKLPDNYFIYYADTKNAPYGVKKKEEVRKYIFEAVEFISQQGIDALVVACNTATSVAIIDLRKKYNFYILGMEPAVKPAIIKNHGKKILVLATSLTLKESKLESLIKSLDSKNKTVKMEMDALVRFAESFDFNSFYVKKYLKDRLLNLQLDDFETIVLGCTHFIFYKELIQDMVGNKIEIIDGNAGTINNLKKLLLKSDSKNNKHERKIVFYSSGIRDDKDRESKLMEIIKYESSPN
jgi:glutamate racemase